MLNRFRKTLNIFSIHLSVFVGCERFHITKNIICSARDTKDSLLYPDNISVKYCNLYCFYNLFIATVLYDRILDHERAPLNISFHQIKLPDFLNSCTTTTHHTELH